MSVIKCKTCGDILKAVKGVWTSCNCGDLSVTREDGLELLTRKPSADFEVLKGGFVPVRDSKINTSGKPVYNSFLADGKQKCLLSED